jgi:hypothetical protein
LLVLLKIYKTQFFPKKKIYIKKNLKEKEMKDHVFIVLLLMVIAIHGAWAQNLPAFPIAPGTTSKHTWASSLWTSPQSSTTEGRYRSNADDYIRPDSYAGVKFNRWFGMTSFLWAGEENSGEMIATAGFATRLNNIPKVNSIFIGAFYSGNFWTGAPVNDYINGVPATTPNGGVSDRAYDIYNNISAASDDSANNFALLIGLLDMGFRLTWRTNYHSFNEKGIVTNNQLYKSYKDEYGYIAPQIAWAYAKDLTKNGIRPYASLDLVFYRDYNKVEAEGDDAVGVSGTRIGRSLNRFDPSFAAGLGGYAFYSKDGFKLSADFDYVLGFNTYSNEYSIVEDGKYKTRKIAGEFSPGTTSYFQKFFVSNQFTPSLSGSWSKDRLALKFKLNFPLMFSTRRQDSMDLNDSNALIYDGESESTNTFTFRPDLRLAMQYKIIPNRLTLNMGARIQATTITIETIQQEIYTDNVRDYGRKIHRSKFLNDASGTQFVSRFSLGVSFNLTENIWFEANTGITNKFGNEAIDLFAPGGLFSFGSILAGLKF